MICSLFRAMCQSDSLPKEDDKLPVSMQRPPNLVRIFKSFEDHYDGYGYGHRYGTDTSQVSLTKKIDGQWQAWPKAWSN